MVLAVSDSTLAVCVERTLPQLLADDSVSLVFQGTVIDRRPVSLPGPWVYTIATFEVTRVWKGQVDRSVNVNFREGMEGFPLEPHKDYLVIATLQSAGERQQWGAPPDAQATFGADTGGCNNVPIESQWRAGSSRDLPAYRFDKRSIARLCPLLCRHSAIDCEDLSGHVRGGL